MPPRVMPQTQSGNLRKPGNGLASALSRIQPVSGAGGFKFLAYGRPKVGKTRFASTFPKPLLLIGTEDGTKSIMGVEGIDFVQITHSSEFEELVEHVRDSGRYKTVCLDHATGFQDLLLKEVLGLAEIPVQKSWGMAQQQDWQAVAAQFKEKAIKLFDLADKQGTDVVVLAHERTFGDENKVSEVIQPSVGAALTPAAAGWLHTRADYIGYSFIREEEGTQTRQVRGKTVEMTTKTGKVQYCMRIGSHTVYTAGFRITPTRELPDVLVNPHYDQIHQLVF